MHFELDRRLTPEELADLEDAVRSALAEVRRVVRDFPALRERIEQMIEVAKAGAARYEADEVQEAVAFLQWLPRDNFILLGARDYELRDGALQVVAGSGLGLLDDESRSAFAKPVPVESLDPGLRERALGGDLLLVSKTNRRSRVHRRVGMDYVGIRRVGDDGQVVGESRLIGLFTTKAYAEPASETPVLHRKLRQVLASEDLIEGSHDYKAAVTLFESFPKDELFAAPTEDLDRAPARVLQGRGAPDGGGRRHRGLRALVHRRADLPRRAAQRARGPDPDRHVPRGRQRRAVAGDADPRAPRAASCRGAPDTASGRRGGDVAAGLRRPRADRPAARSRGVRRSPGQLHRRGVERRCRVG